MPVSGFQPIEGTRFSLVSECGGHLDVIDCAVRKVVVDQCLAFSWRDDTIGLDSLVTITLDAQSSERTRVTLTQTGWSALPESVRETHESTWKQILNDLKNVVRNR